jgi:hypothetical protein
VDYSRKENLLHIRYGSKRASISEGSVMMFLPEQEARQGGKDEEAFTGLLVD